MGHDGYSNQYQGNNVNFDHYFNDRDQSYSNSFGNYENNYDNRRQNFTNGHNYCHNVAHAGETPSRPGVLKLFYKIYPFMEGKYQIYPKIQSSVYLLRAQKRSFKLNFWLKLKFVLIF